MRKIYSLFLGGALVLGGLGATNAQTAKTVPYSSPIAISSTEFDDGWTYIDANNDADGTRGIWGPSSRSGYSNPNSNGAAARYYSFTGDAPADDYLVSPAIHLEANKEYKIMYGIATESTSYPKDVYLYASTVNTADGFKANEPLQYLEQYKDNYFKIQGVNFTPTESGDYYFAIYTDSPNQNYYLFAATFAVYVNEFTPEVVTNLKAERNTDRSQIECTLSWTLPTKSVFGDDFDENQTVEQVNIYRDGSASPVKTLQGAATEYVDNADAGLTAGIHTYEVEVVVAGKKSAKASATSKYVGPVTPATVPYTWACVDADAFEDWTTFAGEGAQNTRTWTLYAYGTPRYAQFVCEKDKAENNYLVAPPFAITEAGYYKVTFKGNPSNNNYSSKIALRYGHAPTEEALTGVVTDRIEFTSNNADFYSYVAYISEPGTYYFAAVASNPTPDYGINIYCHSIGLEKTEKTPAAVTNLTATPDPDFNLEVVLNWTCPTLSSNGEALAANEYKTEVYKADQLLTTLDGGVATYTDSNIEQPGAFTYSVKTVAAGGASVGAVTIKTKWVGKPIVALPYKPTLKSDDDTVATWDILDNNNDGSTWKHEPTESSSFRCVPPAESAEGTYEYDDYLLTPYFEAAPGYYELQFRPFGPNGGATIKYGIVKAGSFIPEREELDLEVNTFGVSSSGAMTTHLFKIEEAGEYQVVFAVTGAQGKITGTGAYYQIGINAFSFAEYPVLPGLATDLAVEAAADEVLEATLTWTNPTTTNVEGVDLEAIAKAVIIRDGQVAAEVEEGLVPGQTASFLDSKATGLTAGPHTYSVEIYNAAGKSADAAPEIKLDWVGGALDITEEGITHDYADFDALYTFVDVHGNQKSSYDGWSISGTTAMKVDETNSENKYDDWAISPRFNIKKDGEYEFTFEHYIGASYRDYAPYTLDVYLGEGTDYNSYTKIGEVVSINASSTASNFETTTIYIKGADLEEALINTLDEDAINRVNAPYGSLSLALHATQKGGVFIKTIKAVKTYEPEEAEEPAIPEGAYVVYSNGTIAEGLTQEWWWNASWNATAENPDGEGEVFKFYPSTPAENAAASMGLLAHSSDITGPLHSADLHFSYYAVGTGNYTVRLTCAGDYDYNFSVTAENAEQWNDVTFNIATQFPELAEKWNKAANLGNDYVFSVVLADGSEDAAFYFNNVYYTNVDEDWTAPVVEIPAPDTVPAPEHADEDVLSFFSSYGDNIGYGMGWWGQTTDQSTVQIDGQDVIFLRNFNYLGWVDFEINISDYDYMHVDYWTPSENTPFGFVPISLDPTVDTPIWNAPEVVANQWNSYDAPLDGFSANLSSIKQIKFVANQYDGTTQYAYLANVYFWKDPNKEDDEPGQNTGSVEGTYTQDGNTFDYTLNYAAYLNENGTVTVQGAYVWADGNAPVGYLDSLLYITVQGDGEIQTSANSEVTTSASTYTEGQIVTITFNAPVAGGNVIEKVPVKLALFDGIDGIDADGNNDVKYFNLQGVRVDNPTTGVYIVVRGNEVSKQVIR